MPSSKSEYVTPKGFGTIIDRASIFSSSFVMLAGANSHPAVFCRKLIRKFK